MKLPDPLRARFIESFELISQSGDSRERMARIIGRIQGMFDDDPEIVEAIDRAFKGNVDNPAPSR